MLPDFLIQVSVFLIQFIFCRCYLLILFWQRLDGSAGLRVGCRQLFAFGNQFCLESKVIVHEENQCLCSLFKMILLRSVSKTTSLLYSAVVLQVNKLPDQLGFLTNHQAPFWTSDHLLPDPFRGIFCAEFFSSSKPLLSGSLKIFVTHCMHIS